MASTTRMITAGGTDRASHMRVSVGSIGGRMLPIDFRRLRPLTQALDPPDRCPTRSTHWQTGRSVRVGPKPAHQFAQNKSDSTQ
jgi:hypothetical protein